MDWADSPQQAEFRATVRAFFEANLPQRYREDAGPLRPHMIRASNGEEILATHAAGATTATPRIPLLIRRTLMAGRKRSPPRATSPRPGR